MKNFVWLLIFGLSITYTFAQSSEEKQSKPVDALPSDEILQKEYEEQYKNMVSEFTSAIEDKSNPMVERAENAYQQYESSSVAGAFFDDLNKRTGGELKKEGAILFFFSSSMPERTIKTYLEQAEKINTHILFVIRGTIDNTVQLLPTVSYLKEIKTFTGCGKSLCQRAVNTVIDSRLFEQYGITQVPAILYTGEFSGQAYFDNNILPKATNSTVVVGEATLPFLVKTLSEEINDEGLTAIAKAYSF